MKICVLLELETSDPRIDPAMIASVAGTMLARQAVMEALPRDVTRVVGVLPVEVAEILMRVHDQVATEMGEPPAGHHAPTRRRGPAVKLTLEPTDEFFHTDAGFPVRAWTGHTDAGTPVVAFIAAITVADDSRADDLARELHEIPGPNVSDARIVPSFVCPRCGVTSHNPNDAEQRYCGRCHLFFNEDGSPELQL